MSLWLQKISEINVNTFMDPPPRFSSFLKEKPLAGRGGPSRAPPSLSPSLVPKSAAFSLCFPGAGCHFEDSMHLPKHVSPFAVTYGTVLRVLNSIAAILCWCWSRPEWLPRPPLPGGGAQGVLSWRAFLGLGVDHTGSHCTVLPPSWARLPLREECVRGGASLC